MLVEVANQEDLSIYVVLTMRSDFFGDCSQFEELAEAVNKGEYLVPRLNRENKKTAIEGRYGWVEATFRRVWFNACSTTLRRSGPVAHHAARPDEDMGLLAG